MNLDSFIREVILPTARKNKGGTFDVRTKSVFAPTSGYFVSYPDKGCIRVNLTAASVREFIKAKDLENIGKLGLWRDGSRWYFDVSLWVGCLDAAIELGKRYNQIAIWDCANNREIVLEYN